MNKFNIKNLLLVFTIIFFMGAAYAAPVIPDISDAVKQVQPPKETTIKPSEIPSLNKDEAQKPVKADDGAKIFVKAFKITGNKYISSDVLLGLINKSENLNKEYTITELNKIASLITKYYRSNGYFVARAYFPKQDSAENVLTISILEGYYGKFKLNNKSLVGDKQVQGMLDDIKDKNIISTDTIERAMLIINDTPGVKVTQADVLPGEVVGTSDFAITASGTRRFDGYVVADNYGSRYTGDNRLIAGFGINSPFNSGDRLSFMGMTTDSIGIINGRIAYSMPLMYNGLRGEFSYARTNYELGNEYESLDATGTSDVLGALFTYPVIKSRLETLTASADFSIKKNTDKVDSAGTETKKTLYVADMGADYSKVYLLFGMQSSTQLNANFTFGSVSFEDAGDEALDDAGADTGGIYMKASAGFEQTISPTKKLSLTAKLTGQQSLNDKNFDGSEDLSVGGSNGVRAYPSGELSAENGFIFSFETSYKLPSVYGISGRVGIFYDAASVSEQNEIEDSGDRTLTDAGIGYYANYKNMFLKAEYAKIIGAGDVESEPNYQSKLLIQAGMNF